MGLRKMVMLLALLVAFFSAPGYTQDTETYHFEDVVNEVVTSYGLDPVEIQFEDLQDGRLAAVSCFVDTNECTVSFDYCVMELNQRIQRNIAVHEGAHYVNAQINRIYDHGRQWQSLMRDHRERPIEVYEHWETPECD